MFKKANITVGPAGSLNELGMVDMPGNYLRCKEADWPFEISFDDGDWLPFDVGMEVKVDAGSLSRFQRFKIRHNAPTPVDFAFLVGDGVSLGDNRFTGSRARNAGSVPVNGPLTDTQLRATPVPVSGTVSTGLIQPLTDTQLRATPVPVSGTVSTGLIQPLTDTQLRATPVPVSGTVSANLNAGTNNIGSVVLATNTTGGLSTPTSAIAPATPAAALIGTTNVTWSCIYASNSSANWRYLKLFNASSVTLGTTSASLNFGIPPGRETVIPVPIHARFATGFFWAVTGGIALNDNTAIAANEVAVNFLR